MVTFLSGGTGTPKLLWGLADVFEPSDTAVVANTGDDIELGGLHVSPDVDSMLFERSGELDRETWWGIADDPTVTTDELGRLLDRLGLDDEPGYLPPAEQTAGRPLGNWRRFAALPEFMTIGDRDRAVHRLRTHLLDRGATLTEATGQLATAFDVDVTVLPMSDDPVASLIHTGDGIQHFQEFWVARGGEPAVQGVEFRGAAEATPAPGVRAALSEPVIVGPANPVTSLGPMLAIDRIAEWLERTPVVAVSPFLGEDAFSGPAAKLLEAVGTEPGAAGMERMHPWIDAFVLDEQDSTALERPTASTDIRIETRADAVRVLDTCETLLAEVNESCSNLV